MKTAATHLFPAEAFVLRVSATVALIDVALILVRGPRVDLAAYGTLTALVTGLLVLGLFYRRSGRSETIGAMATSAGLFIFFTAVMSLFNYLLTPNPNPPIDNWLFQIDTALGYDWPEMLGWAAQHLWFNEMMRFSYASTLPQIALLLVVLSLSSRMDDLHGLMITVVVAGTISVMFWGLFPSAGAKAYHTLPDEVLRAVRPIVDPAYGAEILALLKNGSPFLSPNELRGLIAFPSFHIVLAVTATYYARNVRWLFALYLVINLIVLPAVLVHGGHHLADIPAGIAVFAFAVFCTRLTARRQSLAPVAA
ncbi:MAG: phosphatase PAP2 family protein [Mesorhizobium sp.]|nr:phosphatase PAP2 family protein [Mesorhizobium sp.]